MTELRRDYLVERWVIIAKERSKRPSDFRVGRTSQPSNSICPFCPGNEHLTSPATLLYLRKGGRIISESDRDGERVKGWLVRVVPNLYPALRPDVEPSKYSDGFTVRLGGRGAHEVIIETPKHNTHIHTLDNIHLSLVFRAYTERFKAFASLRNVAYVSLFRNYGVMAGASLSHPHSQIIATPILPPKISEEVTSFKNSWDGSSCTLERILEREVDSERFVDENNVAIAFCPYASEAPFEVWVAPKKHVKNIADLSESERNSFARLTRKVLRALYSLLRDPPYNYFFHQSVSHEEYHMHLRILPKLSIRAGFELNTAIIINPVSPEDAAKQIREIIGSVP